MAWVAGWRRVGVLGVAGLLAACGDTTAPDEARFPVVEGVYGVETLVVANTCRFGAEDGARVYVFFQENGGEVEFRPPAFNGSGRVVLRDLGIRGQLEPDGRFEMVGTYTIDGGTGDDLVVGFTMNGRFDGDHVAGTERHLAAFPGGSCEATFSFEGDEV
ncbi:MAG: hypothetical protein H0V09_03570 [Gemmatimonadetes bacterium]|nr:hypothetical protein [Gemmatimonadota bacterium]